MKPELVESLQKVVSLSEKMIDLARSGDQISGDVQSGIVFGILRDCGYKLRRAALKELEKAGILMSELIEDNLRKDSEDAIKAVVQSEKLEKKVLIVDDEPDVLKYLQTWFEDHGFSTHTAKDGVEALNYLGNEKPALITLDMSMPEKSGVRTYREIKESPDLKEIPVIVITAIGKPMKGFLEKTRQVPAPEGFIPKPIELRELATLVKELVA